ncbi:GNAT family N-acetyltransferase [Isoptericola sp. b441]|uniref:GNAT family N-acetyltransferase n=1 Tax=Actinotalea lenta TaxID=3064654 RepID=A0ABT9DDH2_9CELL|nr:MULTISPECIES: GNAT family N-acetyltransferase [unclassified Isoptericola]MDO8107353.1 GNAT family N-acetyltransferase [Isoptericola sp. b441]MDO8120984.1 GNAT family N-acetyltransferase [Isoptericola sp. b490]
MAGWRIDAPTRRAPGSVDLADAARLCAEDPVGSVLAAARIEAALAGRARRGGPQLWGVERGGELVAVAWAGANLVPVVRPGDEQALDVLAETALNHGRRCSSIVGPAEAVLGVWQRIEPHWGPAREVRADQPSMVIDGPPARDPDPQVRLGTPADLPALMPACVAMFTEEVGYSPLEGSPGSYEARVRGLVDEGRSYVRMAHGPSGPEVLFKAELGAVSSAVAQVQGVWVPPEHRSSGLATAGMAAVVGHALATVAPRVSLYVNDYNAPALRVYRKVGFRQVGTYATVLF